jgi:hypothetical protein
MTTTKPFWTEPLCQRDKDLWPDMPCEVGEVPDPDKFRAAGYEVVTEARTWHGTQEEWEAALGLDHVPPANRFGMVVVHVEEWSDTGWPDPEPEPDG